jgi:murein DD-endopeptidase MepM/ murein hydrolase activator NlpD
MTRVERSFPIAFRLLAAASALVALAWLAPTAGAQTSASGSQQQSDVQAARAQYRQALAELDQMNAELDAALAKLQRATRLVETREAALEKTTAQLLQTRQRLQQTQARYDRVYQRLNDRAGDAFIEGPGTTLEYILGSASFADLSDRLEFIDAVTQANADLAQKVENLGNKLEETEAEQARLQEQRRGQLADAKDVQTQISAQVDHVQQLRDRIAATADNDLATLTKTKNVLQQYRELLRQQARDAATSSGHAPVPLPAQYQDILKVCPVEPPRYFGDGFGAPRYAGGFHLHAGVDILADYGTEIFAPFDGVAHTSYNTLGGYAVYVEGADGYVYNAHLEHYSPLSNGPVQAGDVIGYVGDTGDAIGTPHDHFEFHPNFPVPSDWPTSYYGYRVIGTAVNPYPLLVAACG